MALGRQPRGGLGLELLLPLLLLAAGPRLGARVGLRAELALLERELINLLREELTSLVREALSTVRRDVAELAERRVL